MLMDCSGKCGKRIYVKHPEKPVYLCKTCYAAFMNVTLKVIGRGRDVFRIVRPNKN